MSLKAFLAENALKSETVKFAASKRFIGEDGKPMEWELQAITSQEDEEIRKECTKRVQVVGKKGQYTKELDADKYTGMLAVHCTVFPDLHNAELQDSYRVKSADALLKTMLLAGEYADYLVKVQEICGFNEDFDEKVEEAKN